MQGNGNKEGREGRKERVRKKGMIVAKKGEGKRQMEERKRKGRGNVEKKKRGNGRK